MRRERYHTTTGLFVAGALTLLLVGSVLFYHIALQAREQTFVLLFKGSLRGLEATAPVKYRGVKIGEVSAIEITENIEKHKVEIPVYVRFFVKKKLGFSQDPIQLLIRSGFVADLSKPNFLTGLADIELVKTPPPRPEYKKTFYYGYPVFPTRNTTEKYTTLDEALTAAKETLEAIQKLVSSADVRDTINAARQMADSLSELSTDMQASLPAVIRSFTQSLDRISSAAYSTQTLTDYLSRNPEALLRGKR